MKYLQQIYFEMRHQKMMTWVSIAGTALAIFLVMVFYLVDRLNTVEVAPESNRDRILIGQNMHVGQGKYDASSALNHHRAQQLYHGLEGVERESYMSMRADVMDVTVGDNESVSATSRNVDHEFWNIYDFEFIDGRPFEEADVKAGMKNVIITRSLARKLFNEEKVAGREILIGMKPYRINGVVKDANPILPITSAEIFGIYTPEDFTDTGKFDGWFGFTQVALLMKKGVDAEEIRRQVRQRYQRLEAEARKIGAEVHYHEQPYDAKAITKGGYGSNTDPEDDSKIRWIIYAVLILLPAINLSSMTRSRLRHRVSEIGVRRAFGATRASILNQTLTENFIITLIGGAIGLALSIIFMTTLCDIFVTFSGNVMVLPDISRDTLPSFAMVFSWQAFAVALGLCFLLNLLSAFIPSWKASRISPSEAIGKVK